ncbi:hypothetical protein ACFW9N_44210 [Streptomyces sp. NPDC059496]|uniref:hypothetical protein n=1 Tax=Streptomyces sp. NPDC059496 TaxID=3346851 RepID=UPI0036892F41
MSLIDGGAPSPDWVALDMEAMLRECDGTIASKDDELRRLEEAIEALKGKKAKAAEERQQAVLARQKAQHVLVVLCYRVLSRWVFGSSLVV